MTYGPYEAHQAAEIFPLMKGAAFDELKADIKDNGQHEPIVIFKGQILDGRNRYRACQELGIEPLTIEYDDITDPSKFVVSMNLHRRHLNESQRAMIAAKLANDRVGGDRKSSSRSKTTNTIISNQAAADMMNISRASVELAKAVLNKGEPDDIKAIESGDARLQPTAFRLRGYKRGGEPAQPDLGEPVQPTPVEPAPTPASTPTPKTKTAPRAEELLSLFGDGKWHRLATIAERWGGKTAEAAQSAIRSLDKGGHIRYRKRGPNGVPDAIEYLFHAPRDTALIPVSEIREKLMPYLKKLQHEGVRNPDLADTVGMATAAWHIHWQIDEWGGEKISDWTPGETPPDVAAADAELVRFDNVTPIRKAQ